MREVPLEQGSAAWHKWRSEGVGASEIPILLGTRTYGIKTPLALWEHKMGYRDPVAVTAAMHYGNINEEKARRWLVEMLGMALDPLCVEAHDLPHMKASLDGYNRSEGVLVEIKCPVSPSKITSVRATGALPKEWLDQMQWQMLIADPAKAYLAVWDGERQDCVVVPVYPNHERQRLMKEKADAFWEAVKRGVPPEPTNEDYVEVEDEELLNLCTLYAELTEEKRRLTHQLSELKDEIIPYAKNYNVLCGPVKVRVAAPRKTLDKQKMEEDGIELSLYEKVSTAPIYTITTFIKEREPCSE